MEASASFSGFSDAGSDTESEWSYQKEPKDTKSLQISKDDDSIESFVLTPRSVEPSWITESSSSSGLLPSSMRKKKKGSKKKLNVSQKRIRRRSSVNMNIFKRTKKKAKSLSFYDVENDVEMYELNEDGVGVFDIEPMKRFNKLDIDPKTYLANEKTLLKWINSVVLVLMAGISLGISNDAFLYFAAALFFMGVCGVFYTLIRYRQRHIAITRRKISEMYSDPVGPYVIMIFTVLVYGAFLVGVTTGLFVDNIISNDVPYRVELTELDACLSSSLIENGTSIEDLFKLVTSTYTMSYRRMNVTNKYFTIRYDTENNYLSDRFSSIRKHYKLLPGNMWNSSIICEHYHEGLFSSVNWVYSHLDACAIYGTTLKVTEVIQLASKDQNGKNPYDAYVNVHNEIYTGLSMNYTSELSIYSLSDFNNFIKSFDTGLYGSVLYRKSSKATDEEHFQFTLPSGKVFPIIFYASYDSLADSTTHGIKTTVPSADIKQAASLLKAIQDLSGSACTNL